MRASEGALRWSRLEAKLEAEMGLDMCTGGTEDTGPRM